MKLETILNAAKNSMLHGKRKPHCFSCHIPGKGYTGDSNHAGFKQTNQNHTPMKAEKLPTWKLVWSPEGKTIAIVRARTADAAKRKAPMPYRKYLGELYAELATSTPEPLTR